MNIEDIRIMQAIVIGGTLSGSGKTTVATGLMSALCRRGLKVQPFKTGPDYIDPGYHNLVTGQVSRNLDTWMLSPETVIELYYRAMRDKEIAVIEGVMGLFDGRQATADSGSTAELAKLLGAPVILVLDCKKGARSLAALVHGYQTFDKNLTLGGVILNGIGSTKHLELCREAIEYYTGVPVLGHLPKDPALALPERHLGLLPSVENPDTRNFLETLTRHCTANFNLAGILKLASQCQPPIPCRGLFPPQSERAVARIGLARDKAFSFYYQDNLDLLQEWGAELAFFSPLTDSRLPENLDGLYIGGGFPELYAAELSANREIRQQIKNLADNGLPVYAECGGLMYLGSSVRNFESLTYDMVGALPCRTRIDNHRLSLGYRTVEALRNGPLMRQGETARGHEFHWSVLDEQSEGQNAYAVLEKAGRAEGYCRNSVMASYIHLHFGSLKTLAPRFVRSCLDYRTTSRLN